MEMNDKFITKKIYKHLQKQINNSGCNWSWEESAAGDILIYTIKLDAPYGGTININGAINKSELQADYINEKITAILKSQDTSNLRLG